MPSPLPHFRKHPARLLLAGLLLGTAGCGNHPGTVRVHLEAAGTSTVVFAEGCALTPAGDAAAQHALQALARRAETAGGSTAGAIDYPLDETVFPPDLAAPTFRWRADVEADEWLVSLALEGGAVRIGVLVSGALPSEELDVRLLSGRTQAAPPPPRPPAARGWQPDAALWSLLRQKSVAAPARVTVIALPRNGRATARGAVTFTTSRDPVGAPIFYRDVPLMPSATETGVIKPLPNNLLPLVAWRLRDIGQPSSRLLLTNLYTCANCHSFSADGRTLGMDVDGPTGDKGAYALAAVATDTVIRADDIISWNDFPGRLPGRNTLGFLSRVSPDGRYVVSTVNEEVYVANFPDYRFLQVFYPTRGIFAWYDRKTGHFQPLPGADDPQFVHCDPAWSPDGRWLVFARARARDAYPRGRRLATRANDPEETPIQYDLVRLPFHDGRGGPVEPVTGATGGGVSHSFPAVSPDGRWIVYVASRNGQLLRPDGALWIVPFAGGTPRRLRCNTACMNSWHSFAPNGRWLVFASKANTPYTQMFLTHLDEQGNDTPPVLIENATAANRAVNLPEFVGAPYDAFQHIATPTLAYYADFQRGSDLAEQGRIREAAEAYRQALRSDPDNTRVLNDLGVALGRLGALEEAAARFRRAIAINPGKPQAYANLALVLVRQGALDEAASLYDRAIRLDATIPEVWYSRGRVKQKRGDAAGAIADYGETLRLAPDYVPARVDRASLLAAQGRLEDAARDCDAALRADPRAPAAWCGRGLLRRQRGDAAGAAADFRMCLEVAPAQWEGRARVQALLDEQAAGPR